MTIDLAAVRTRARVILEDANSLNYSNDQLDEAARQALSEYNTSFGSAATLKDLDSASSTTIASQDEAVFIMGAAAFAAHAKASGRALQYDLNQPVDQTFLTWAKNALAIYRDNLRDIKRRLLRLASTAPYTAVGEGPGTNNEEMTW
jgi:hypothetical protein